MNFQAPAPESKFYYKKYLHPAGIAERGWQRTEKGRESWLLKMCTRQNSGSFTSNIFGASEKSLIVWNPRACPLQGPAISQHSVASPRWGSRVGITRFRGNKWETLLNNGDKDHLGHLSVALPWMCVHCRARNECSQSLYGEGSFWGLGWVSRFIRSLHLCQG